MGSKVRQADEYLLAEMLKTDITINYDKFYKDDLIRMVEVSRKLYKKQKKIIDKAINYLKKWGEEPDADMYLQMKEYKEYNELLDILKEVK